MAIWDNVFRELQNLWETLTGGEPETPIEETPEEEPESGGFFDDEPPEEPPDEGDQYDDDEGFFWYRGDGPYPFEWDDAEQKFWNANFDGHFFDNQNQYEHSQDLFYQGYMAGDDEISHEERVQARQDFLDYTYFDAIDWESFREYWGYDE